MGQWIRGLFGTRTRTNTGTSSGSGNGGGTVPPTLSGLNVNPTSISSSIVGEQIQINAAPVDQFGNLFNSPVTYQAQNQSVATVSAGGLVTIVGNGTTPITVTAGAFSKTVIVTVNIVAVTYHLAWVTKPSDLVFHSLGVTGTPVAKLYDSNNVLAPNQPTIAITVTDPTIFSLSGNTLTSLKNGVSAITASALGVASISDNATVAQVPVAINGLPTGTFATDNNSTGKFNPTGVDANGQTITNFTPTFNSANTNIIAVDTSGNWTTVGKSTGNTTVTVGIGSVSVTFNIAVSAVVGGNTPNMTTGQYIMGSTGSAPMAFDDATKYVSDADWKQRCWATVTNNNFGGIDGITSRGNNIGLPANGGTLYTDGGHPVLARWNSHPTATFKANNFNPGFDETCFEMMIEGANLPTSSATPEGFFANLPNYFSSCFVVERAYQPDFDSSGESGGVAQATGDAHIFNVGGTMSNGTVITSPQAPGFKSGPFITGYTGRDGPESAHWIGPSCTEGLEQFGGGSVAAIPETNFTTPAIIDGTLWQWEFREERWLGPDGLWHGMAEMSYRKKGTTTWILGERYIGTYPSGYGNSPYFGADPHMKNCNQARALDAHLMWWQTRWAIWNTDSNYDPMGSRAWYALQPAAAPTVHSFNSFDSGTGIYVGNVTIDGAYVRGLRPYKNGVAIVGQDYTIPREYQGRYVSGVNSGHILPTVTPSVSGLVAGDVITWHSINGNGDVEATGSSGVSMPAVPLVPTVGNATAQTSSSLTFPVTLNSAGSVPTALAVRISTDNATWTNLTDITLTSPTLGQVVNEVIGGRAGSTLYYIQFAEKNALGQSAWSASATGTTSAIVAVNHSFLYPVDIGAATGAAPTGTKSSALPLPRNVSNVTWEIMRATSGSGGASPFIFTNANGGLSSTINRAFASMPLVAATIPAMNYTLKYGMYSEAGYGYQLAPVVYVWRPSTGNVVGYIIDSATGLDVVSSGASSAGNGRVATVAGASVTVQDGDILCWEWWCVTSNAPSANYVHVQFSGPNDITEGSDSGTTGRASINFATPIAFQS